MIFLWYMQFNLLCDPAEKEAILEDYKKSFYIQSIDDNFTYNQSDDLEKLFQFLKLKNKNHSSSFIFRELLPRLPNVYEDPPSLNWVTKRFLFPNDENGSLVLYGCHILYKKPARITIFHEDMYNHSSESWKFPKMIPKTKKVELSKCYEQANVYIQRCLYPFENLSQIETWLVSGFILIVIGFVVTVKCICC